MLDKIIKHKREEIFHRRQRRPVNEMSKGLIRSDRSFEQALRAKRTGFIFECKKASPSRGVICPDFNPVKIAQCYAKTADAISVLTDEHFFSGRHEYLRDVRNAVNLPVLCKDFIIDPYQIIEARLFGADAVLLMLSVLDDQKLYECKKTADALKIDSLAEVHNEQELNRAISAGFSIIGINNRNLKTLQVDLANTAILSPKIPGDRVVVCESGISSHREIVNLRDHVDAFLVGSALTSCADIEQAVKSIVFGNVKICGLTKTQDAQSAFTAGATHGGLIFSNKSKRQVSLEKAREIVNSASLKWVGVFVNEPLDSLVNIAQELNLHGVQLHGDESSSYISDLSRLLPGCTKWKAQRVHDKISTSMPIGVDKILLDTFSPQAIGGTGKTFDWSLLDKTDISNVILGGGLDCENIANADKLGVCALDVNSGVETKPGIKNHKKLDTLFAALRGNGRLR